MGPSKNTMTVVDNELRVHGMQSLRIADASIMPSMPSANIGAAVFMIAEKASDLILGKSLDARVDPAVPIARPIRDQYDRGTVQD